MNEFLTTWLPNIVCTVGGCILSWAIGWRQGLKVSRNSETVMSMLRTALTAAEEKGLMKLARDSKGNITDGRVIEVVSATGAVALGGHAPGIEIKSGPSSVSGVGQVTPASGSRPPSTP